MRPRPKTKAVKNNTLSDGLRIHRYESKNTHIRKSAFKEYISTIVDWDHSTGESANVSAPATAPPNDSNPDVPDSSPSSPIKSCAERHISMAVHPAASAPATAEKQLIAHAGVGWPIYVTQKNSLQNNQLQRVQNGYPGGCGTPRCAPAVASSPESSSPTEGPSVKK